MTLTEAITRLRETLDAYKQKRKRYLDSIDVEAITVLLTEVHRKDRL